MAYLDHAATTPMRPETVAALTEQLAVFGNSSSLHAAGRRARRVVEESRETIAAVLDARPSDVIFTGSGTEADNLAVKGIFWSRAAAEPQRRRILTSAIEHHAVLDAVEWLGRRGEAEVELLPVDREGRLDVAALEAAIARDPASVALISVMWANNEIGTVQPVAEVVAAAAPYGIPVHSDAVQAVAQLDVSFAASGLAAMTLSPHKFGGPLGVGALVLDRGVDVMPLLHGGGQERDVRSGTHDTPHIAAFAVATEVAVGQREGTSKRVADLRDDLVVGIRRAVPDAVYNGAPGRDDRLPGNAHFAFPGCEGDALLMLLDAQGVECSTGSACSAGVAQPSHVLTAIGATPDVALSSLRFSLGHTSTAADVEAALAAIAPAVARARDAWRTSHTEPTAGA